MRQENMPGWKLWWILFSLVKKNLLYCLLNIFTKCSVNLILLSGGVGRIFMMPTGNLSTIHAVIGTNHNLDNIQFSRSTFAGIPELY